MDRDAWLLREKLEAFLRDEAESRLALARRDADADPRHVMLARHAWLASPAARDLLGELRERGRIGEDEALATARHLARFVRERELCGVRTTLRAFGARRLEVDGEGVTFTDVVAELFRGATDERLGVLARALEGAAVRALVPIRDARDRGDEAARVLDRMARPRSSEAAKHADEARSTLVRDAEGFLSATKDLREEALSFLAHCSGGAPSFASLASSLRLAELDDVVSRHTRARRFTELVAPLAVGRELSTRVRVEASTEGLAPRVSKLVLRAPTDVRLVPSSLELGILSELSFVEAAGSALVLVLANPALPPALLRPHDTSFASTIGRLLAMLSLDAKWLGRDRRVPDRVLDRVRRAAATVALFELRVSAAAIALAGRRDLDAASDRLSDALGVRIPGPIAALVLETPRRSEERFRAGIAALAGSFALRDLHDEDYLRNPRMAEQLRVLAGRGGGATAETFLAETRTDAKLAPRRLAGWFQGRE